MKTSWARESLLGIAVLWGVLGMPPHSPSGAEEISLPVRTPAVSADDAWKQAVSLQLSVPENTILEGQALALVATVENKTKGTLTDVPRRLQAFLTVGISTAAETRNIGIPEYWSSGFGEPDNTPRNLKAGHSFQYSFFLHMDPVDKQKFLWNAPGTFKVKVSLTDAQGAVLKDSNVVQVQVLEPKGADLNAFTVLQSLKSKGNLAAWPHPRGGYVQASSLPQLASLFAPDVAALEGIPDGSAYARMIQFYLANVNNYTGVASVLVDDNALQRTTTILTVASEQKLLLAQNAYKDLSKRKNDLILAPQALGMTVLLGRIDRKDLAKEAEKNARELEKQFKETDYFLGEWPDLLEDQEDK